MLEMAVVSSSTSSRPNQSVRSVASGFERSPRLISSAPRFNFTTRLATCLSPTATASATASPTSASGSGCSCAAGVAIRRPLYPGERQRQMCARTNRYMAGGTTRQIGAPGGPGATDALDERARRILSSIVRDHIRGGEPVGSHAIAARPEVDCSSATVRAVMADLEALGFLEKPHTSAGRVPTASGYRYYVDVLLHLTPPLPAERELIERSAQDAASQVDGLMAEASRILHRLTRHAGVVASPRPQGERLRRIEFLKLREGRILAVLVSASGRGAKPPAAPAPPPPAATGLVGAPDYLHSPLGGPAP